MPAHLFIGGVPCTGKSLLGKWLARERGWLHIDADDWPDYDNSGIHAAWDVFVMQSGRSTDFVRAVNRKQCPIGLDCCLPMEYLFVIPAFQDEGVATWWFYGEKEHARKAFVEREEKKPVGHRIRVECFDTQMYEINRHWRLVERLFGEQDHQRTPR